MRNFSKGLTFFFLVLVIAACTAPAKMPESAELDAALAERNYRIGEEVESISEIRMDDRTYVNNKTFILPAAGDADYLVSLKHPCIGLQANPVMLRNGKHNRLEKYDRMVTRHNHDSIDQCFVDAIYELVPGS